MLKRTLLILLALVCLIFNVHISHATSDDGLFIESLDFELGVIINIRVREVNRSIAGYYFGVIPDQPAADNYDWIDQADPIIRTTKFPGHYYLWLRDTKDVMYGPYEVDMPDTYYCYFEEENTEFPPCSLEIYLKESCNYSVDELNNLIAENVAKAGVYTREAVVVGITTYLSKLQEFHIRIPFFFYGYWPVREYGWYVNPDWGTVYELPREYDVFRGNKPAEHERGTHCNGFVHYAFRLAALNIRNTYDMGETGNIGGIGRRSANRINSYHGRGGDILQSCTNHEMLIIDKYDDNTDGLSDGYIVAESNDDAGGQAYCKKPFDSYSRVCRVFDMTGVFENTATQAKSLRFWQNYHIPQDAWPDYLKQAVNAHTIYSIHFIDAEGIRTIKVPFREKAIIPEVRGLFGKLYKWDIDLTGVAIERNYTIHAVYDILPSGPAPAASAGDLFPNVRHKFAG